MEEAIKLNALKKSPPLGDIFYAIAAYLIIYIVYALILFCAYAVTFFEQDFSVLFIIFSILSTLSFLHIILFTMTLIAYCKKNM